jgi:hypothetical protein
MKNILSILLVSLLLPLMSFSQNWQYKAGGSAFDGKYKTSYVQGVGNKFPYNKPLLTINKFDNQDEINFYISGAGYFQEGTNTSIRWVFNNEPGIIYSTYSFSYSSDGQMLFLTEFNDPNSDNKISKYEFINKLKNASKVSVRTSDNYGSNDIVFSLNGSTKAINSVIPLEKMESKISEIKLERQTENNFIKTKKNKLDTLLEFAEKVKISSSCFTMLKMEIEGELGIGLLGSIGASNVYASLKFKPSNMFESYGYVDVFYVQENGSEKEIYGTWQVEMDSPLFKIVEEEKAAKEKALKAEKATKEKALKAEKAAKEKEFRTERERIRKLLSKYKVESLKEQMLNNIISKQLNTYANKWELSQVSNVTAVFSDLNYGKIYKLKLMIHLNNNQVITIKETYISSLEITKKQLREMGGKLSEEF